MQDLATAQLNWNTDDVINNSYDGYYAPAACCCWRYHTIGTQQGDWYVPAVGEWGYAAVRCQTINDTINKIVSSYGNNIGNTINGIYILSTMVFFDSNSYANQTWIFTTSMKWQNDLSGEGQVRAFCRLSVDGNIIH